MSSLIVKTYPGVFGGVSSQDPSLRKDNQVTEMINCIPSLVLGTIRRPNVEEGGVDIPDDASFIYDYKRDSGEAHIITCNTDGELRAFTIDGDEDSVTVEDGVTDYLKHTNTKDLTAITLGDTTYIVNTTKEVTTENVDTQEMPELDDMYLSKPGDVEVHQKTMGYYWLSRSSNDSDHKYRYVVKLDGQEFKEDSDKSDDAASALCDDINDADGWNAEVKGSIIRIWKDDFADFTLEYWDSWGSMASFGWKYDVGKLQDLPNSFPWDGAVIRVNSSDGNLNTNYYVMRWKGAWREFTTRAIYEDDTRKLPLLKNMPVIMKRESDGSYNVTIMKTADMLRPPLVGNDTNNKDPNFVGKTINQIFYMNGRIGVVSGDSVTFSETNMLWNFYVSTVINVLDSDTLEVKIASEKVLQIYNASVFQSGVLLMTSEGQYLYNTENGISPTNVYVNRLSNYNYNPAGGTIYDGDSIVFTGTSGTTSRVYRYRVARLTSENKAIDLTIQVPTYIEGEIQQVRNYTEDGTLIVRVKDKKFLYLYKEIISGDQMVQSSWYKWDFSNIVTDNILHITVINNNSYM